MTRPEHPLIVLLVDALARECGYSPKVLWDALDGKPSPPRFVRALVEAFAPGLSEADFVIEGSTSVPNGTKVGTDMQAPALIGGAHGRPVMEHPFTRALYSKGLTVTEWAKDHDVDRHTVKFWYVPDGRQIPRSMADLIEKELKVPATARTWKNGIREGK